MKKKTKIKRILLLIGILMIGIIFLGRMTDLYQKTVTVFHSGGIEEIFDESKKVSGGKNDFIDISKDMTKGIPRLYQWDKRWRDRFYGTNKMEINGCGPTCLSMVWCGLTRNTTWNPYAVARMAEEKGFYVPGTGSSWELMTEGGKAMGLQVEEVPYDADVISRELKQGRPIICAMGPGDFTTTGHFIVLTGITSSGEIIINDPNSKTLSEKTWDLEVLMRQMKNLWSYSL